MIDAFAWFLGLAADLALIWASWKFMRRRQRQIEDRRDLIARRLG